MDEHTVFNSMIDNISKASADAEALAVIRTDQPWRKVAAKLDELKEHLLRMVGEGHVGGLRQ